MTEQDAEITFCRWHPETETGLSCYQCGAPICGKCAKRTPVGYICPDCQKSRKDRFEHAKNYDYLIAAAVSLVLGTIAGVIIGYVSWWYLILFISPIVGGIIAEAIWRLVGRRYGRHLWWIIVAGIVLGAVPGLLMTWNFVSLLLHIPLAAGAVIARLRLS